MINAYPLTWPDGWKRTPRSVRENGRFNVKVRGTHSTYENGVKREVPNSYVRSRDLTVSDAVGRILQSLERMGADRQNAIISTNVLTRLDGMPRSGERAPDDPGAAVYWVPYGKAASARRCMAIDRYTTVADNLAAIGATLEAMRAIERHGGAEILDRAFTGFLALPEKASTPWRDVLGIPSSGGASVDVIELKFKELARLHHPDRGGDPEQFHRIVEAHDAAKREMRSRSVDS
jgi:hypothetical protein